MQWLQTHAIMGENVDWVALRKDTAKLISNSKTTADTYPAICFALRALKDENAWMLVPSLEIPNFDAGYSTLYPENRIVVLLTPNGPAEQAGLHVGDLIQTINGKAPQPYNADDLNPPCNTETLDISTQEHLTVLRDGQSLQITINKVTMKSGEYLLQQPVGQRLDADGNGIGYIELPVETGDHQAYADNAQQVIKKIDSSPVCGWIIDLRRTTSGDIWSYIAAVGPILGEGELGGFVYLDGTREPWAYRNGEVFWNNEFRPESTIDGAVYTPKRITPVALLIGPGTQAASELLVVAFRGRADVRTFGEPTWGLPTLVTHTALSDDTSIFISGAFSFDRNGVIYDGPIAPDVPAETNWSKFGTEQDPAVQAAQAWLSSQTLCKP
jgi:C-terminal processing protease CtpA/Prc